MFDYREGSSMELRDRHNIELTITATQCASICTHWNYVKFFFFFKSFLQMNNLFFSLWHNCLLCVISISEDLLEVYMMYFTVFDTRAPCNHNALLLVWRRIKMADSLERKILDKLIHPWFNNTVNLKF